MFEWIEPQFSISARRGQELLKLSFIYKTDAWQNTGISSVTAFSLVIDVSPGKFLLRTAIYSRVPVKSSAARVFDLHRELL
jgi:hypothetical protein